MDIKGKITGIKYKILLSDESKTFDLNEFNINTTPATCLLKDENSIFAISKWISPKRTRSYPFERVYNTLNTVKKITVIPVVKDEGAKGDRDFIQWDTISLMSLLDVFVILAYYDKAKVNPRNPQKITNQQFNNEYVIQKIKEINHYHSSALHWNLNELNTNFHNIIDNLKKSYIKIEKETNVKLHSFVGIDNFKEKIGEDVSLFMEFSRAKAEKAQMRESVTLQPKERLSTLSKAKITIMNYLGGLYFFTVDEIKISQHKISLIEGKHSEHGLLPSKGDIKDGLLKMILYSNLCQVTADGIEKSSEAVLSLTSCRLKGCISSYSSKKETEDFCKTNNFSKRQISIIQRLFEEAQENQFTVQIHYSK